MQKRNQFLSLLSVITSIAFFVSCEKRVNDYIPKEFVGADASLLRVVNTATLPNKIAFYINSAKYSGDTLSFTGTFPASEFLRVPSGTVAFKATTPANSTDIYTANLNFAAGKYNTLFLIDTLPTIDAYVVTDNELIPPADSGKVAIRFVHVAKGVAPLTLANTTVATAVDTLFKNIAYKTNTPFVVVNSGASQKFQLYLAGTATTVAASITISLTPNRMYTLYIRGRSNGLGVNGPVLTSLITR